MSGRPRKGRTVAFTAEDGAPAPASSDPVAGLRFAIAAQSGGEVLIDYTGLRPRPLAIAFARALRRLAAPGGPLGVRSTVKAYAVVLRRFFAYLHATGQRVDGPQDLRAAHVDGFEAWLAVEGLSRVHLFTVLVKVVAVLRQVATDAPIAIAPELRDRLRYVSAKPFQRSSPRDALSPHVARQLRDAARADVAAICLRLQQGPQPETVPALEHAAAAAHAVISERGLLGQRDPEWQSLYAARWRRGLSGARFSAELHGAHHLTGADVAPFLVLLALETGLEIECCKALTVDCLRNPSAGTIELAYLKRRARGAEHKTMRVRDGGSTTPGGLIRRLIALTAPARLQSPGPSLWLYYHGGALIHGVRQPRTTIDAWTARHEIIDDEGRPLRLLLSSLRKTHKALWYLKTEGHMARFALGHTPEVAARAYADIPALRPLHDATVVAALEDALAVTMPRVLTPEQEAAFAAEAAPTGGLEATGPDQDVWLASCSGFTASPFGEAGAPCPAPAWSCLDCANAVVTVRKLPAILSFLAFVREQREGLSAEAWAAKFGRVHASITGQILPTFSEAVLANAQAELQADPPPLHLPPEARA